MSIAKVMEEISRLSYGKAREDVILQISKMYYLGQVTAEPVSYTHLYLIVNSHISVVPGYSHLYPQTDTFIGESKGE